LETAKLKRFSLFARRTLIEQVGTKLDVMLAEGSAARREQPNTVKELEEQLETLGREQLIERVAYTWFNRFCALRFMDINRYTRIGIVSPEPGKFQPEILAEAKMGHIDAELVPESTRRRVSDLLDGTFPSRDPQTEAYRLLLVAACNYYHSVMPFLFEPIADWTELLMPDDLLSGESILAYTREALLPINCSPEHTEESVEVIGWLYQFYISEKKDEVFGALKKGKKIAAEHIPAATQLFTPHWIVRYLVENSLGRLWMLNHPESKLVERMDYYIRPEEPETDFLRITSPEDIKICDPACGSGHMLTYAFDLLYAIYEEQGYPASDIPRLILENNLYGIEIDHRAGALAAFALTMKAREKYRRFLTKDKVVQPNICVLENICIEPDDLAAYVDHVGRDHFPEALQTVVNQFEEADNFGSLIRPLMRDVDDMLRLLRKRRISDNLLLAAVHSKVLKALTFAEYLSCKYHVVVANPPYFGIRGMNSSLTAWAKAQFPATKSDLFAMFIERNTQLVNDHCFVAMVTMHSWMFLSSLDKLRRRILDSSTVVTLAHLGARAFDTIGGEVVSTAAFVLEESCRPDFSGTYISLTEGGSEKDKDFALREAAANSKATTRYSASSIDFNKVPGSPLAYWLTQRELDVFANSPSIGDRTKPRQGMSTNDNERFLRLWFEVSLETIGFGFTSLQSAKESGLKWFPYNKGGEFRKWRGNDEYVVNWKDDGAEIKHWLVNNPKDPNTTHWSRRIINTEFYFAEGLTWSFVSSSTFAMRYLPSGYLFDVGGSSMFPDPVELYPMLGYMCSPLAFNFIKAVNPTLNFQTGNVASLPWPADSLRPLFSPLTASVMTLVELSQTDWDSMETAWGFARPRLLSQTSTDCTLQVGFSRLRDDQQQVVREMKNLEEESNQRLICAFGLADEVDPGVRIAEITLTCNPSFRYGPNKPESELEGLLLADTMREFVSYAVGCMFGRYSLDKPGLVLANQGETADDYRRQIPEPTFAPDEDNVIPLLDGDWFPDDISERFKAFLKVTFGTEHYEENLTFLENGLYPENQQGKRRKTIRDYFVKEFYDHHVRMYKKRPIYWLFSSPKGTFNALIYMHRYRPDTVSIVLNEYLREFHAKLAAKAEHVQTVANSAAASSADKAKALKEIAKLKKDLKELEDYEHKILYPLATRQLEIDLDDGVKVNYNKFGKALKKVTGLTE